MERLVLEIGHILLLQRSLIEPVSENYQELSEGKWDQQAQIDY